LVQKFEFILCDGFEDVLFVFTEEEELSTTATLSFNQVEHFPCVVVQFEGFEDCIEVVSFEHELEDLGSMDDHGASKDAQPRDEAEIVDEIFDQLIVHLD
jgi:hypothetical protein